MTESTDTPGQPDAIIQGDAFEIVPELDADSVDVVVTSPPYWGVRDYQIEDQFGIEDDARDYIAKLRSLAQQLSEVVADTGSLWLNLGDIYNGTSIIRQTSRGQPDKGDDGYTDQLAENRSDSGVKRRSSGQFGLPRQNRLLLPERVAMEIADAGWLLRDKVIWQKKNPKPEGRVDSRLTQSHEVVFRFAQQEDHAFYRDRVANPYDVWTLYNDNTDHPAPMPTELARRCIALTTDPGDTVCDPFVGAGTVCSVANGMDRNYIGIELNAEFVEQARNAVGGETGVGLSRWSDT